MDDVFVFYTGKEFRDEPSTRTLEIPDTPVTKEPPLPLGE